MTANSLINETLLVSGTLRETGVIYMKAAVLYGKDDLRIEDDFEEPVFGANDVLIQPSHAGLCSTDRSLYRGYVPFKPPLILGHEIAGIIKEVG